MTTKRLSEVRGFRFWPRSASHDIARWVLACAALLVSATAIAEPAGKLAPAPRQTLPTFSLEGIEGRRVELSGVKGDAVIVHFFATWCEPCREEFASLAQLLGSRPDIKILAINVAEVPVRVKRFAEAERVAFPILLDVDRRVTKAWGVSVLPTTFVLDRAHFARLLVEGDLDWTRADVLAAIVDVMQASEPTSNIRAPGGNE
jgi:peroxiredoxin